MTDKIIHFSIDDSIEMFRDISINNYNSLFESKYFSFLKLLHKEYKACVSLYIFIEYNNFHISQTTDKFKDEFISNSHWLKIGFHGYNENSKHIDNPKKTLKYYQLFLNEVYRIAGTYDIIDHIPRLHCYSGNLVNILSLKQSKYGIVGLLSADDDRDNYYLSKNENIFLNNEKIYKDIKNDILFVKTTLRAENISNIQTTLDNIDLTSNIILFTHERFILEEEIQSYIISIFEYAIKNQYISDFVENQNYISQFQFDKIKRYIECYIPVTTCNLRCEYCYITQMNRWSDALPDFKYSPQYVRKALSKDRLGGTCLLNMCAGGETLIHPYIVELIKELLEEGHYVFIVTNGTISKRFDEIINRIDRKLFYRLIFKFSFHYKELERLQKFEEYFNNIKKIKNAGASFTVELTPYDDIVDEISSIKEIVYKNMGAFPHITIARSDNKKGIPMLTKYSRKEYNNIWSVFDSELFNFKIKVFGKKMKKYCYAGDWSLYVNIGNGETRQCYTSNFYQNIFEDLERPINFQAIGKKCLEPHCFNAHSFLTLGNIPNLKTPFYSNVRNRVCEDGSEWLNPYIKEVLSHKLRETNK